MYKLQNYDHCAQSQRRRACQGLALGPLCTLDMPAKVMHKRRQGALTFALSHQICLKADMAKGGRGDTRREEQTMLHTGEDGKGRHRKVPTNSPHCQMLQVSSPSGRPFYAVVNKADETGFFPAAAALPTSLSYVLIASLLLLLLLYRTLLSAAACALVFVFGPFVGVRVCVCFINPFVSFRRFLARNFRFSRVVSSSHAKSLC